MLRTTVLAIACSALVGCAAQPTPASNPATPTLQTAARPTPGVNKPARPGPAPEAGPVVAETPPTIQRDPEPLKLSEEQLKRVTKLQPLVQAAAQKHGVDVNLLNGIIWRESKFNPKARNPSGARGLMQLMPVTGKAMAKKLGRSFRPYDPEFSVEAGAMLISIMLERFDGDEELALFAFGRGGGSARKWQREGGPMPSGVVAFIGKVRQAQHTFEQMGFPAAASGG